MTNEHQTEWHIGVTPKPTPEIVASVATIASEQPFILITWDEREIDGALEITKATVMAVEVTADNVTLVLVTAASAVAAAIDGEEDEQ